MDKLKKTVPHADPCKAIAGDSTLWTRFREIKALRDDLVHLTRRGYSPDPEHPSPFGRLIAGVADNYPEDVEKLIEAIWPGYLKTKP